MKNYQQTPKQRKQYRLTRTQDKVSRARYAPKIVESKRVQESFYSRGLMSMNPVGQAYSIVGTSHTVI